LRAKITSSCPSSLPALAFSSAQLSLATAFWQQSLPAASRELLLGLVLTLQLSSRLQAALAQLSAWPPMRSVSQQPVERARFQQQA
jgi:hypothetical protein